MGCEKLVYNYFQLSIKKTYRPDAKSENLVQGLYSVDPLAEKYYSLSPYNYVANNPINLIDPNGMSFTKPDWVDRDGNTVKVNGIGSDNLSYEFAEGTSQETKDFFMANSAPTLDAMNETKLGQEDLNYVQNQLTTKVHVDESDPRGVSTDNSTIKPEGDIGANWEYEKVTVIPNIKRIESYCSKTNSEKNEVLGAIMQVEVEHLTPYNVKLELGITDYSKISKREFREVYNQAFNRNVQFRIHYRNKYKQTIDKHVMDQITLYKNRGARLNRKTKNLLKNSGIKY